MSSLRGTCPLYPSEPLVEPKELRDDLRNLEVHTNNYGSFPSNAYPTPMQEGMRYFAWSRGDGDISCEQIFASGLIYNLTDILRITPEGERNVYLSGVVTSLFHVLQFAKNFYSKYTYQGTLDGYILLRNMNNVEFKPIVPGFFNEGKSSLLDSYRWDLYLDTSIIFKNENFQNFFIKTMRDIYWSLGFESLSDQTVINFLEKSMGWKI